MPESATLTIDPAVEEGVPLITGTKVAASAVATLVYSGGSVEKVARKYKIRREDVLVACWWWVGEVWHLHRHEAAEIDVLDAWGGWAERAGEILGGRLSDTLSDPPVHGLLETKRRYERHDED